MKEPVTGGHSGVDSMVVCDVDTDYTGRFAVVSSEKQMIGGNISKKQLSRHKENKLEGDEAVEQVVKDMKSQVPWNIFQNNAFLKTDDYFVFRTLAKNYWPKLWKRPY